MTAVDLAAVIVTLVCLATVVLLALAVMSLTRTLRELRSVVDDLRESAVPMVDDLRSTVVRADAELNRMDGVISRAERISSTVEHASRLTHRAFAPPLIKGISLVTGASQATRRLRARRHRRRGLDVASETSKRAHTLHPSRAVPSDPRANRKPVTSGADTTQEVSDGAAPSRAAPSRATPRKGVSEKAAPSDVRTSSKAAPRRAVLGGARARAPSRAAPLKAVLTAVRTRKGQS